MCKVEITENMTTIEMLQVLLHNANTLIEQIENVNALNVDVLNVDVLNVDVLRDMEETIKMGKDLYRIHSHAQTISLEVRGMLSEAMERKNAR